MNLNIINLEPTQWDKATWQEVYDSYCKTNMFGAKTKREYYDFVISRCNDLKSIRQPLSEELRNKWSNGFKNASVWAKNHKCNMYGENLANCKPKFDMNELANDIKDIQWQLMHK